VRLQRSYFAVWSLIAITAAACVSVGEGTGEVKTPEGLKLFARDCWNDEYDLRPDFFAADPFRNEMHIRVQRGSDLLEVSDGLSILVDDVATIRENKGMAFNVTLPKGVAPPGVPEGTLCAAAGCDSPVHIALYLLESCHTQNTVLYATAGTITFEELFDGDPNEKDAEKKLTKATFDIVVGDPRDFDPTTGVVANTSQITGSFEFFFQRGQPAQPFP
jgi:hypothetical protein